MIKKRPDIAKKNIELFERELELLGYPQPVLVAMGGATYDVLQQFLGHKYKVVQIKHYSYTISKENYRAEVLETL